MKVKVRIKEFSRNLSSSCNIRNKLFLFIIFSSKPFFYNISGVNFNLDELKHGLLRGNKKNPAAYMRTLGWNDLRTNIL